MPQEHQSEAFSEAPSRCGTSHKHHPGDLYVPSATPAWERPDRGILVSPPGDRPKWAVYVIYVILALVASGFLFFFVQVAVFPATSTTTFTSSVPIGSTVSSTEISLSSSTLGILSGNESNATGLKLGPATVCTHDCTYPATYITLTVFVNYTSPLRSLNASVDGIQISHTTYTMNDTSPFAILFKANVPDSVMTFAPNTRYNLTFSATFEDARALEASTTATSNP